jgi:hypothetical protein
MNDIFENPLYLDYEFIVEIRNVMDNNNVNEMNEYINNDNVQKKILDNAEIRHNISFIYFNMIKYCVIRYYYGMAKLILFHPNVCLLHSYINNNGIEFSDNYYSILYNLFVYTPHTRFLEFLLEHPKIGNLNNLLNLNIHKLCKDGGYKTIKLLLNKNIINPSVFSLDYLVTNKQKHIIKIMLEDPRMVNYQFKNYHFEYAQLCPKIEKMLKDYYIKLTFRKLNKIVCMERIKKFLLKRVMLRPDSVYVKRLVSNF